MRLEVIAALDVVMLQLVLLLVVMLALLVTVATAMLLMQRLLLLLLDLLLLLLARHVPEGAQRVVHAETVRHVLGEGIRARQRVQGQTVQWDGRFLLGRILQKAAILVFLSLLGFVAEDRPEDKAISARRLAMLTRITLFLEWAQYRTRMGVRTQHHRVMLLRE